MTDIKKGRTYKVSFIGTARYDVSLSNTNNFYLLDTFGSHKEELVFEDVTPVTYFNVGDRVRSKTKGYEYAILKDGYIDLGRNDWYAHEPEVLETLFPSDRYELID